MSTSDDQQKYYETEWSKITLSSTSGKSGWRTLVPAPDFVHFVAYLKASHIQGKVLDLGCGGGRHAVLLAQNGFEVCGIDFAAAAIQQAKANAQAAGVEKQTSFEVGDALHLPYADASFDVVNDDGCLHHIDPTEWDAYLGNITRVLKHGGMLRVKAFSKNCEYFEQNAAPDGLQWVQLKNSGYTYFFTEADIRRLFSGAFEIVSLEENAHTETQDKKFFFVTLKLR